MSMDFTQKVHEIAVHSAISFSLQLAKDIGIFDALRSANDPLTSHQVADAKNLKERYVRELLGCLVSLGLVQISSNSEREATFYLQQEAKEAIDQHALHKVGFVNVFSEALPSVAACCRVDGPSGCRYNSQVFEFLDGCNIIDGDGLLQLLWENVPGLQDRLEHGIKVFEFGSGSGRLLNKLATKFPRSTFTASEVNSTLVDEMKKKWGDTTNMKYAIFDVCQMQDTPSEKYDWILSVDVVHDLPHPLVAMKNIRQMVDEENGLFTCIDMAGPGNPAETVGIEQAALCHTISTFMCIPESFQADDSEAHGATWAKTTAVSLMNEAGFHVDLVSHSDFSGLFVCRCKKQ